MRLFLSFGALSALVAMAAGLFDAYVLKQCPSEERRATFKSGNHYHLAHSLALVVVAILRGHNQHWTLHMAGWAFCAGVFFFPGGLYLSAVTGKQWPRWVANLGGLAFGLGWAAIGLFGLLGSGSS